MIIIIIGLIHVYNKRYDDLGWRMEVFDDVSKAKDLGARSQAALPRRESTPACHASALRADAEIEAVISGAKAAGATDAGLCTHHAEGGAGAAALGAAVVSAAAACDKSAFRLTYDVAMGVREKIEAIAKNVYGAAGIELAPLAEEQIRRFEQMGLANLPICMAKTQYSFSHDPAVKGAPEGFVLPIRDIRMAAGAGFMYPLVGNIMMMPGLPTRPCYYDIDIDMETGKVLGLS